jgi:large subunit ribosomal protein L28
MSKICPITKKKVLYGNNVSHANNKTRRRFCINMQTVTLMSETLSQKITLRMTTRGIRTIDLHGGLDGFLLNTNNKKLSSELMGIKKQLLKNTNITH